MLGNVGSGIEFTEASEFARSIQLREPEEDAQRPADSADHMGVDAASAPAGTASTSELVSASVPSKRRAKSKYEPARFVLWYLNIMEHCTAFVISTEPSPTMSVQLSLLCFACHRALHYTYRQQCGR